MTDKSRPAPSVDEQLPDMHIDITTDCCPMTFVRTRLALDRMAPGALLRVRLRGEEPLANVPRMAQSLGHAVLDVSESSDGTASVLLRKAAAPRAG
jgi:TusA-related sulfurtransferase